VNACIELHNIIFDEKMFYIEKILVDYLKNQNKCDYLWSYETDISYLKLLSKVISNMIKKKNLFY